MNALPDQTTLALPSAVLGPPPGTKVVWQRAHGCKHHTGTVRRVLAGGVLEIVGDLGFRFVKPECVVEVKAVAR